MMISLIRKSPRTLLLYFYSRSISTSDSVQNMKHLLKSNACKLPAEIVNLQKLKNTSRSTLSTLQSKELLKAEGIIASKDEIESFMSVLPEIVNELTETVREYKCNDAAEWFAQALEYNLPRGKKNRGILTVVAYKNLVQKDLLTPENIKLCQYLGWCIEILQSFFIIADDIMDNSITRRGQLCWHRVENVGMTAINDYMMIENSIFLILKKYFRSLDCYTELLELFHEIVFLTTCGQSLDLLYSNKGVETFTMDKYKSIVANKTAHYTFYSPFALAMHLAGIKDPVAFGQSKSILLEMGQFFQVQDDFLDCFGDSEVTGKVGNDIQDNKCTWLAIMCMQRASESQKALMYENYGKNDPIKEERVKELYKELGLPNIFSTYEEQTYKNIKTHIQESSSGVPHEIFFKILDKIYKRNF